MLVATEQVNRIYRNSIMIGLSIILHLWGPNQSASDLRGQLINF